MLNSANFGVAQDRKRVYLVGYLGERSPIEILAFGESGNEDSDERGEQAELKQLIEEVREQEYMMLKDWRQLNAADLEEWEARQDYT